VSHCIAERLAWLVYIIAAIIGGRAGTMNVGQSDAMDAELACKVRTE
jgi:hypothetical protein